MPIASSWFYRSWVGDPLVQKNMSCCKIPSFNLISSHRNAYFAQGFPSHMNDYPSFQVFLVHDHPPKKLIHIIPTRFINRNYLRLPSVEQTVCKSPLFMGKSTISMAIFNSYVSLPECTYHQHQNQLFHRAISGIFPISLPGSTASLHQIFPWTWQTWGSHISHWPNIRNWRVKRSKPEFQHQRMAADVNSDDFRTAFSRCEEQSVHQRWCLVTGVPCD